MYTSPISAFKILANYFYHILLNQSKTGIKSRETHGDVSPLGQA